MSFARARAIKLRSMCIQVMAFTQFITQLPRCMRFHAHAGGGMFRLLRVRTSFIPRTSSVSVYVVGVAVVP